jgi:hypothetical protein
MNTIKRYENGKLVEHKVDDAPIKRDWPLILRPLRLLAKPGDKGLGDIVERVIGPVGGDAYKAWYKNVFGKPCGCTKRGDNLNKRFPLDQAQLSPRAMPSADRAAINASNADRS